MTAKKTMKIHVPAYSPVVEGAQEGEYSGVVLEVKKTLDIAAVISCGLFVMHEGTGVPETYS